MLKLILPSALRQEIVDSTAGVLPSSAKFWGGVLDEDSGQIEEIIPLPPLDIHSIEEVLSEQPSSFDVMIAMGETSPSLKAIRAFCDDIGLYFYHISPEVTKKKKKKAAPSPHVGKFDPDPINLEAPLEKENIPDIAPTADTKDTNVGHPPGTLETRKLREIFLNMGGLSLAKRPQQIRMTRMILDAFEDNSHLIIEASTGTGKSLAYLLCSILLAEQTKERILIATHTKMLQTQLMEKDVPIARKLMDSPVKIHLAKGKSNYLCLHRYFEGKKRSSSSKEEDLFGLSKELLANREFLDDWITQTSNGDLDTLPANLRALRKEICMQSDLCDKKNCPFVSRCFYYKEWEKWEKSSILIVNHALLVSELDFQYREIAHEVIPSADRLIIDEAHHFSDNALRENAFSSEEFFFIRDSLALQKDNRGILSYLVKILRRLDQADNTVKKLTADIEDLIASLPSSFDGLLTFFKGLSPILKNSDVIRVTEKQNPFLDLRESWEHWKDSSRTILYLLREIIQGFQGLPDEFKEMNSITLSQIQNFYSRMENGLALWDRLFENIPITLALWIESPNPDVYVLHMVDTHNEDFLKQTLWKNYRSVIFTSATLSHERSLAKTQAKLCAPTDANLKKCILPPIFDYRSRAKFFIPQDIPDPTKEDFSPTILPFTADLIRSTTSGVLILATSIKQMKEIGDFLGSLALDRPLLLQSQFPINDILNEAKHSQNAIIVGVDSFWEGIDLPGKALELLVVMKLPFTPPGNPLVETLSDVQESSGHNPFHSILLDEAIIKFQQGVGRLLRSTEDHGIVVCLDNRIITKFYGKKILKSLYMQPQYHPQSQILAKVRDYFSSHS